VAVSRLHSVLLTLIASILACVTSLDPLVAGIAAYLSLTCRAAGIAWQQRSEEYVPMMANAYLRVATQTIFTVA
jgi:hypothetical protein